MNLLILKEHKHYPGVMKMELKMRCAKYYELSMLIPPHCYNCAMRKGYPWDLRGDKGCENYEPLKKKTE
jgi:hypothetical protein